MGKKSKGKRKKSKGKRKMMKKKKFKRWDS